MRFSVMATKQFFRSPIFVVVTALSLFTSFCVNKTIVGSIGYSESQIVQIFAKTPPSECP